MCTPVASDRVVCFGLGRIAEVFGGVAEIQGLEPGSSPTSGTCFPCSVACGPLSVHKSTQSVDSGVAFFLWPAVENAQKGWFDVLYGLLAGPGQPHGITLPTESEAVTLKRLLDANNQSFEIAQHAMVANQTRHPPSRP